MDQLIVVALNRWPFQRGKNHIYLQSRDQLNWPFYTGRPYMQMTFNAGLPYTSLANAVTFGAATRSWTCEANRCWVDRSEGKLCEIQVAGKRESDEAMEIFMTLISPV